MLFYRSPHGTRPIGRTAARIVTTAGLASYPAGALVLRFAPDAMPWLVLGYGLVAVTLACALALFGTDLQRIVADEAARLDEFELTLRARAMFGAYAATTGLALVGILYAAIATDAGWWVPHTYEEFNGVFWGAFAYSSLLPSAVLAWIADRTDLAVAD